MGINKIGGGTVLQAPPYPISLAPGQTFTLPVGQGGGGTFGGAQYPQLGSGNALSGQYLANLGTKSELQVYSSTQNGWTTVASAPSCVTVSADGTNFRLANTSGSPASIAVTAGGSGYTNGFYGFDKQGKPMSMVAGSVSPSSPITVTASDGSTWNVIVGGSVNPTISVSGTVFQSANSSLAPFGTTLNGLTASGGSGYTKPPLIMFGPPPNQGMQPYVLPTATCTVAAGAITAVTVTNPGAGLLGLPSITVVPQPGDTGGGAVLGWLAANNAEVGTGAITSMSLAGYGNSGGTAPTLTFAGGGGTGAAATVTQSTAAAGADTVTLVSL